MQREITPHTSQNQQSQQPLRTREVGTVTQFPAHDHVAIPVERISPEYVENFWSKVDKSGDCWEWLGGKTSSGKFGYGHLKLPGGRAQIRAHRLSYFLHYGRDPREMFVCHTCDNPGCVNPHHLFLGTARDNNLDKISKGRDRYADQSGARNGNSRLSVDDVHDIVRRFAAGHTNKAIAADYPVSHSMVSKIRAGRMWREVTKAAGYTPTSSKLAPKSGRTKAKPRKD